MYSVPVEAVQDEVRNAARTLCQALRARRTDQRPTHGGADEQRRGEAEALALAERMRAEEERRARFDAERKRAEAAIERVASSTAMMTATASAA